MVMRLFVGLAAWLLCMLLIPILAGLWVLASGRPIIIRHNGQDHRFEWVVPH